MVLMEINTISRVYRRTHGTNKAALATQGDTAKDLCGNPHPWEIFHKLAACCNNPDLNKTHSGFRRSFGFSNALLACHEAHRVVSIVVC